VQWQLFLKSTNQLLSCCALRQLCRKNIGINILSASKALSLGSNNETVTASEVSIQSGDSDSGRSSKVVHSNRYLTT
jgi:hypothetical protein